MCFRFPMNPSLQWGRSLSTTESFAAGSGLDPVKTGFNGAAVFRLRKEWLPDVVWENCGMLQWGRSLSTTERPVKRAATHPVNCASMGPQSFDYGKCRETRTLCCATLCFNGAAVFRLRK